MNQGAVDDEMSVIHCHGANINVADGPRSVIVEQVTNGLAMRMSVLSMVMESRRHR